MIVKRQKKVTELGKQRKHLKKMNQGNIERTTHNNTPTPTFTLDDKNKFVISTNKELQAIKVLI